jgi:hypothetical protein
MKTKFTLFAVAVIACAMSTARAQSGGPFELNWCTIDNGGGVSRGGQFELSGTIGQHDAGALTGGQFKLEGGFWNGLTVAQTAEAPVLKIKFIGGQAILSWPLDAAGYILEETSAVAQPNTWNPAPQSIVNTATEHTVTVPALGVIKCYRLKRP